MIFMIVFLVLDIWLLLCLIDKCLVNCCFGIDIKYIFFFYLELLFWYILVKIRLFNNIFVIGGVVL